MQFGSSVKNALAEYEHEIARNEADLTYRVMLDVSFCVLANTVGLLDKRLRNNFTTPVSAEHDKLL